MFLAECDCHFSGSNGVKVADHASLSNPTIWCVCRFSSIEIRIDDRLKYSVYSSISEIMIIPKQNSHTCLVHVSVFEEHADIFKYLGKSKNRL